MNSENILAKIDEALKERDLDFTAQMAETYALIDGVYVPTGSFTPVRSDKSGKDAIITRHSFSQRFTPIQNREAFSIIHEMAELADIEFQHLGSWGKNGAGIYAQISLGTAMEIGSSRDKVGRYLSLVNSHDGSRSLQILITPFRFSCSNQIAGTFAKAKQKNRLVSIFHDSRAQERLREVRYALNSANNIFAESEIAYKRLADRIITMDEVKEAIARMLPYPTGKNGQEVTVRSQRHWERSVQRTIETFMDADNGLLDRLTGWNLYNAIQGSYQHGVKKTAAYEYSLILGGIAHQAEESFRTVEKILFEGEMKKNYHPEFDEVFKRFT